LSQRQALADIEKDLAAPERMLRLLQGDVGSGKTVVALIAAANVIEAGGQAHLAPTELLVPARAHHQPAGRGRGIAWPCSPAGGASARPSGGLADGSILPACRRSFQAGVASATSLVVIGEQHRFGVHQRR
jgi:ATP-dependent DNA helicase RecG